MRAVAVNTSESRAPHERPPGGPAAALAQRITARIPMLETARLWLRAPRIMDFQLYARIACSQRARFMGGPMTREEAWDDFARTCSTWLWRGHGAWVMAGKADGAPLGVVVLGFEPGDQDPELGIALIQAAEGRGLALEATQAARNYAFRVLELPRLVSYVSPDNTRSIALMERLGAQPEPTLLEGSLVYRHMPPTAQGASPATV
ncbi:MAG: GNAT family N-acetyltransferase [Synechococcus sp. SB0666_bin_14]|nr:GNAT family N-acetyltransferase [Synechococcus sp. SB0666_bin_14]MYA90959.1 GNAT family N-acetyltransferase [Synechococcus sp. SB0663_bin_10]MYG45838.1 GNAT family N-acetyltransferase [Synechococcus sp. SB0675_bin_6]MYJ60544.1 GNAT family N-acetyltransferase [Synechococcus sp. SB0672_bin_6]MYK92111.1 GNAT family N-acetyltransferase [Synechococcus sp. SB0669_bin_8]